jgi:hypothetical protein
MNRSTWKREEREVARAFNSSRALRTGTDEKSDVLSETFCIDTKLRQRWEVEKWFDELQSFAEKKKKIPILTLRKPNGRKRLAVVEFEFLMKLLRANGLLTA